MKAPTVMEQMKPTQSRVREDDGYIHLAVLPFDDLSPQGDNQWFADGMLDELIGTLSALRKLRVPSRSDVLFYKKHHMKTREVADDLGVRYLVEGSVRKAGNKIRISASLIDSNSNNVIWTNKFDGSFDDIFDFQDSVAHEIVDALKLQLTPEEEEKVIADPTKNAEAYELYLKAIEHQRKYTREGYENSIVLLDEALELDSRFTDAYVGKSYAFATYYREYSRDPKWLRSAEEAIELAEQVSLVSASTLRARAEIAMLRNEYSEAEKLLQTAIYEQPTYKELYNLLGNIYLSSHRMADAREAFAKALSLKEDVASFYNLMIVLSQENDVVKLKEVAEASVIFCTKQIRRTPDVIFVKLVYAYSLYWAEKNDDALIAAEELLSDHRLDATMLYNLGILFEQLGDIPRNFQLIERAVHKGFRQIEVLREMKYDDDFYTEKLKALIAKLEELIRVEQAG
jgi:adenylate cyclase